MQRQRGASSIGYRPHIDGLRAVAVLLVIFHHLGDWGGLTGGFIGVDVFFVISGFLITTIVRSEVEAGTFSLGGFYKRRVVRLAPAYFTVLLFSTVAALVWMLPGELLGYARSMAASSLFLANFYMWKEVGGYFGASPESAPLLHLWSLAVEEQFYLFWPALLLIVHRLLSGRWISWLLLLVIAAGAVASQFGVERHPAAAYYLLPTRFFELAMGAALAYLPAAGRAHRWAAPAAMAGMGMVLWSALAYGRETAFPGYAALPPVVGTAMMLYWGGGTMVGKALSVPAATFVGRISYPAYLWHWPIIAFLGLNGVAITAVVGSLVVAATLLLAWLTYRWVELPAHGLRSLPARTVILSGGLAPIAASVTVALALAAFNGFPGRFPESLNHRSDALLAYPDKVRGGCHGGAATAPLPPDDCILGRRGGPVELILVGDSHANHFTGLLDVLAKDANLRGYDVTRNSTPFLPGVERWTVSDGALTREPDFARRNAYVAELLRRRKFDTVVLAGVYARFHEGEVLRAGRAEDREAFRAGMRAALRLATSAASRVVVLETVPRLADGLHDCTLRAERYRRDLDCALPAGDHLARVAGVKDFFEALRAEFPDVVWLDPAAVMCNAQECVTEMNGTPLYRDDGHLNDVGSRLLARVWIERFGNPLKREGPPAADAARQAARHRTGPEAGPRRGSDDRGAWPRSTRRAPRQGQGGQA